MSLTMGFLCGLCGAFCGAIIGIAAAFFAVAARSDGNDFGDAFAFFGLALVGIVVGAILGLVLVLKLRWYARENWDTQAARRKTTAIVAGSILAAPAFVAILIWGQQQLRKPPSDQQLLRNFDQHRTIFEMLAQMTQADGNLRRVDYNWTDPGNPQTVGVSQSRVDIYRRLLESAHLHRGFYSYSGGQRVEFLYWGHGSAISSDEDKGYAYLTVPPKEMLPSLDNCQADEKNGVQAYRHIEGCWYLYYDYLPG